MRLALLVPSMVTTVLMVVAYALVVAFENQVSPSVQAILAEQELGAKSIPFMNVATGGNLVFSFGAFLAATLVVGVVLFVPLYLLDRRARSKPSPRV